MQPMYEMKSFGKLVQIQWAQALTDYKCGDCFVVVRGEDEDEYYGDGYLDPMTLDDARAYIAANPEVLGFIINDCRGLIRDSEVIFFDLLVAGRNH